MKQLFFAGFLTLTGAIATAEEHRIELNNTYPLDEEMFILEDRIFHAVDNDGWFEVVEGPFTDGPARCLGSGFSFKDGTNTISGLCVFGSGEDTFTMSWRAGQQGAANTWEIVMGTGRYTGMTGEGVASTDIVSTFQALPLRRTHIVGSVMLSD